MTATVAFASSGLLALAVWFGWLGADVGRGGDFCEAARDGLVKQPANTFSNVGFVVAGLLIAWQARSPANLGSWLRAHPALATAYAALVALLGPASAAMHATETELGGLLDMTSMYLVAAFMATYALTRWRHEGTRFFAWVFAAIVVACELVGLWDAEIPVVQYAGNLAFGLFLIVGVVLEVRLHRRAETVTDLRPGIAGFACLLVAFVIWNLAQGPWCDPHSLLQGHAAWHLLCAVAAYFLFLLYASETTTSVVEHAPR